jgi:peptidoglycan-N-acetylmuramic acid deacetylase
MLNIFVVTQTANAYSNEALHWGFKRSTQENQPDAGARLNQLLAKHDAYYLGDTSKKDIYLTFDNGYENGFTPGILDTLKKKGVPAAFFVTGHYLKDQPELIKRMVDEGHIVGNHSWGHPDMTTISDQAVKEELAKVSQTYEALTGQKGMSYLRPPRGIFSERTLALSREMGYYNIFWSLAFIDWKVDEQKGWKYAYDNIMKQIHPGAILLLHSVSSDNAEALGKAIDDLQERGYHFRSLDRLLLDKQDVNSELIQ